MGDFPMDKYTKLRNEKAREALAWYDQMQIEESLTRDEFHLFVLGILDEVIARIEEIELLKK